MPDLSGLTVSEALAIAGPLGLALIGPDGGPAAPLPGLVADQRPAMGVAVPAGSAVTVWTTGPGGEAAVPAMR